VTGLERILVRLPNWLGDALMARPALHALRAAHPAAEITAVGPGPLLELFSADRLWQGAVALPGSADEIARLRAARFDAALVMPPSFSSAWLALRAGARRRVGFAQDGRTPLLTRAIRRPARGDLHLSREYLMLAAELGATPVQVPALAVAEEPRREAAELLGRAGLAGASFAVLGPGAVYGPAKRWGPERFAALGRRLGVGGLRVLVCGGGAERETCGAVAAAVGGGTRSLAGSTSLPAQAALCAQAALVVCNDSGLAHLAAATGAPTVTVFGSTSSAWSAPLGPRVRVVQRAPVCSPCFARTCVIGYACLEAVAVEDVARAAQEVAA